MMMSKEVKVQGRVLVNMGVVSAAAPIQCLRKTDFAPTDFEEN